MTYKMMDWACDLIRHHRRGHGVSPQCLLITFGQAQELVTEIARTTRGRCQMTVESVRKGEAYLMGVPIRLFEAPNG
jgi:hypothetical protein